jgi:hypothetical protein
MEEKLQYHYINRYYDHQWEIEGDLNDTIYDLYNNGDLGAENLNCKFIIYQDNTTIITLHVIQFGPFAIDLDLGPNVLMRIEVNIEDDFFTSLILQENEWIITDKIIKEKENELNTIFSNYLSSESINDEIFSNPSYANLNSFSKELLLTNIKEAFAFDLNKWKAISLEYFEKYTEIRQQILLELNK